jgi:hypothetical protein
MKSFDKPFFFRPRQTWAIVKAVLACRSLTSGRPREGVEFYRLVRTHQT